MQDAVEIGIAGAVNRTPINEIDNLKQIIENLKNQIIIKDKKIEQFDKTIHQFEQQLSRLNNYIREEEQKSSFFRSNSEILQKVKKFFANENAKPDVKLIYFKFAQDVQDLKILFKGLFIKDLKTGNWDQNREPTSNEVEYTFESPTRKTFCTFLIEKADTRIDEVSITKRIISSQENCLQVVLICFHNNSDIVLTLEKILKNKFPTMRFLHSTYTYDIRNNIFIITDEESIVKEINIISRSY